MSASLRMRYVTVASSHDSDHATLMVHKVNSGDPKTLLNHLQPKVPAGSMIDINESVYALVY